MIIQNGFVVPRPRPATSLALIDSAVVSPSIRKRAVLHGALGYPADAGLLPDNPLDTIAWQLGGAGASVLHPAGRDPGGRDPVPLDPAGSVLSDAVPHTNQRVVP